MQSCVRRVASKPMAAVRDEAAKDAEELCASGQCAAAVVPLQRAIYLGDLPSRALKAWLLIDGREGVAEDQKETFKLAEEGARWGCHHCQGVLAYCLWGGYGCVEDKARSLNFARESAGRGSKYGQYALGWLHQRGGGGIDVDNTQALSFYRLAAAQGLDEAQYEIGDMYRHGWFGVSLDHDEALRWYQLAAAQGYAQALFMVAYCHDVGEGVRMSKDNVGEVATWEG
jgi:TPR repeat protein